MTAQRRAIVDEIMSTRGHITPAEVAARVQDRVSGVNASTVYRTLELLEEVGVLTHAHVDGGAAYHHAYAHDHVHLICSNCRTTRSVPILRLDAARAAFSETTGFVPDFTHFAIWGLCENCAD